MHQVEVCKVDADARRPFLDGGAEVEVLGGAKL
jgi:hypothetical protein